MGMHKPGCDCISCLLDQIPAPAPGFTCEALSSIWSPDPDVALFCVGCGHQGDCVYDGDKSAETMCRYVRDREGR